MLNEGDLANRQRQQQSASGSLGDTPFGPSNDTGFRLFNDPAQARRGGRSRSVPYIDTLAH